MTCMVVHPNGDIAPIRGFLTPVAPAGHQAAGDVARR